MTLAAASTSQCINKDQQVSLIYIYMYLSAHNIQWSSCVYMQSNTMVHMTLRAYVIDKLKAIKYSPLFTIYIWKNIYIPVGFAVGIWCPSCHMSKKIYHWQTSEIAHTCTYIYIGKECMQCLNFQEICLHVQNMNLW